MHAHQPGLVEFQEIPFGSCRFEDIGCIEVHFIKNKASSFTKEMLTSRCAFSMAF